MAALREREEALEMKATAPDGGTPELIQHFFGPKNTGHTWKYITEL